jgi:hypothetical protein
MHCAGVSLDRIAEKFGVKRDAIWRHSENHMSMEEKAALLIGPAKLHDLAEACAAEATDLRDYYGIVRSVLFGQLMKLAKANDASGVAVIAARITHVLRDIGKMTGELSTLTSSTVINFHSNTMVLNSAPFTDLQQGLIRVCARHPEALPDIMALFTELDDKYTQRPEALASRPMREIEGAANVG